MDLQSYKRKLDRLVASHSLITRKIEDGRKRLAILTERIEDLTVAQRMTQTVAEQVQAVAHQQIASVVTRCLQTVFGIDTYSFRIDFVQTRGKTEARLLFVLDGQDYTYEEVGGGTIDVAALALRITCILLARPKRRLCLISDEPMKHLNGEVYQERVANLLVELSKELSMQFIITTDDKWLEIGKVVRMWTGRIPTTLN